MIEVKKLILVTQITITELNEFSAKYIYKD